VGNVQFGVFVPQFKSDFAWMRERAVVAEEAGFDSFWVMDHLLVPGAPPCDNLESWTLLTALAGATSRIRLGHLVGCGPFRHPVLLAKMAATLDQVSGGRLELGLGWGSAEDELEALGFGPVTRRERSQALGETLEILRLMFAGDPFDYAGRHFQLSGAYGLPRPVQDPVPIHIGGGGRTLTMPLVAEHADWWNCVGNARGRLEELAELRGDARISAQYPVGLAHSRAAVDDVAATTERRMPEYGWGRALVGTPDMLAEQLAAERERGVELFVLRFHDFGDAATLKLFGKEVVPALQSS
jgi:alkanesulfonate monooxygenase SsuD/methylene tetrahydromethanopterin reductase-like flavin-dependent oxidoreductase (luciferase family)